MPKLRIFDGAVLFVPDLPGAVQWYRMVFDVEPWFPTKDTASFTLGEESEFILINCCGDLLPDCAVLCCDDLESCCQFWRQCEWFVSEKQLKLPDPFRAVILRDPGGNFLFVVESPAPLAADEAIRLLNPES
jgi:hypothetical protein